MTLSEVAKQAGVSIATVSRVLKNNQGISPDTRQKVLVSLRKMGYSSDSFAELLLQSGLQKKIDILLCPLVEQKEPISMPYYASVLGGVRSALAPNKVDISININFHSEVTGKPLIRQNVDGVVLVGFPDSALLKELTARNIPFVIHSNNPEPNWSELVTTDKYLECFQLAGKLVDKGMKRIAVLIPEIDYEIYNGLSCGLHSRGLKLAPEYVGIVNDTTLSNYIAPIHRMLMEKTLPDVVVCVHCEVMRLFREMMSMRGGEKTDQLRFVFFADHAGAVEQPNAMHILIDSFAEGKLVGEWILRKLSQKNKMDGYCITVPMKYINDPF